RQLLGADEQRRRRQGPGANVDAVRAEPAPERGRREPDGADQEERDAADAAGFYGGRTPGGAGPGGGTGAVSKSEAMMRLDPLQKLSILATVGLCIAVPFNMGGCSDVTAAVGGVVGGSQGEGYGRALGHGVEAHALSERDERAMGES